MPNKAATVQLDAVDAKGEHTIGTAESPQQHSLFAQHQLISHEKIARLTQILEDENDHLSDQKGCFES